MEFRSLKSDEIDCRVQTVKGNGLSILLYKDARCDMKILDETVGCLNWQREHVRENKNCIVSIWDAEKKQWVSKEDTGTESNTEQAKGLASDSFKRACFNWGIGRELYSAPFIWINDSNNEYTKETPRKDKWGKPIFTTTKVAKFNVEKIKVEDGAVVAIAIRDTKKRVFVWEKK